MMHCSKRMRSRAAAAHDFEHVARSRSVPRRARPRPCAASPAPAGRRSASPTTEAFQARSLPQIDLRLRRRRCRASLISSASSMTLAACSSALEGMQPTFRHTPPSSSQRSTSVTLSPEVRGAERRGIAARAGAEHQQLRAASGLRAPQLGGPCRGAGMRTVSPARSAAGAGERVRARGAPAAAPRLPGLAAAGGCGARRCARSPGARSACPWRPCRRASAAPR